MEMISFDSKAIKAAGYDEATRIMKITFKEGKTFTFCNVPPAIYHGLRDAVSKGGYYHDHIKGRYHC
ncbi:MAG TPA: KTSC domain-containing protein [Leptospiraceae bacterium]|nr:KTSC domain-containing protein [Spirochaetaceae bacterium]HBS07175.1 KTSC domain-containing protein [Leptospiraceae bacterium]|tara:strand:- start:323 stop:523 length:201 start_codon:yes stop_codon:yes gene_type:complete